MKKQYTLHWENGQLVSIEVNGIHYTDIGQIPDAQDRAAVRELMEHPTNEEFDAAFDEEFEEAFEQLERDTARFPTLIMGIFALIALIMLAITAVLAINAARQSANEETAVGMIIDMEERNSQGELFYYPIVEFYLPNEQLQTVTLTHGSTAPNYEIGEEVIVLYNPLRPREARIDSVTGDLLLWIGPVLTGIVGIGFVLATVFAGWYFKTYPATTEETP